MIYHRIPLVGGTWGEFRNDLCIYDRVAENINPVLGMFDLQYFNSDHHLRQIAVAAKTADAHSSVFCLSDQDSGTVGATRDSASLKGMYMHIGRPYWEDGRERSVSGTSSNRTGNSIPIPELGEDEVFVLRGFQFWGSKNRNHHLREIGLRYMPRTSSIDVSFIDDSPRDDEYEFAVYYYVLRSFCAERQWNFCLFPVRSHELRFTGEATAPKLRRGEGLISGFHFRFNRSDRHLARIAIDLTDYENLYVAFRDKQGNKEVSAVLDYVVIDSTSG